jgi:hypothetical protein
MPTPAHPAHPKGLPDMTKTPAPKEPTGPMRPQEAAAQAAEFLGFTPCVDFDLGDEIWTLPAQSYMPPDMKMCYLEHLRFMNEDLDTEDVYDAAQKKKVPRTVWPLRQNGVLIDEDELLCRALMGDDVYEKFLKAGGVPGQVQIHWTMMNRQIQERMKSDPK